MTTCDLCTKPCPRYKEIKNLADGRMFAMKELANLCKKIENGTLVEVVRCKDCRAYGEMLPGKDNRMICHKWALNFEPNHYCSYGARKDGGVDDEQRVH